MGRQKLPVGKYIRSTACASCGSHDALAVYSSNTAFCYSCGTYFPEVNNPPPVKSSNKLIPSEVHTPMLTMKDIQSCSAHDLPDRKLTKATLEHYGVKTGVDESNPMLVKYHFYPSVSPNGDVTGYFVRTTPKIFSAVGTVKGNLLFGQNVCTPGMKLFITEGQIDCLTLYQCIKENQPTPYKNLPVNVVSLAHGVASAAKELSRQKDFIESFKEVTLVLDSDEPGQNAVKEVCNLFPKFKVAKLSAKDPSSLYVQHKSKELYTAVYWRPTQFKPEGIVHVGDIKNEVLQRPEWGISTPWPTLTKLTYGWKQEKIYGFGGGEGLGKSEFKYQIAADLIQNHEEKVGIFDFESSTSNTVKKLAGKLAGKHFHLPDSEWTNSQLSYHIEALEPYVTMFDHFGCRSWEDVLPALRHMVVVNECKWIFLDPLSAFSLALSTSEANDVLNKIMSDLSSLTKSLSFTCFYFSHLNPPKTGKAHDRGGFVTLEQFSGSRAMARCSDYVFGLERNKDPILTSQDQNITRLSMLKDREAGRSAKFSLFWDPSTGMINEVYSGERE